MSSLYPFQEETVKKSIAFLKRWGGCYVANEQGLGKCLTSIDTVYRMGGGPTLIISPAVMLYTWEKEIYKWSPHRPVVAVIEGKEDNSQEGLDRVSVADWVIISYNLASKSEWVDFFKGFDFKFLIMDEAHYLKNHKAKRTKAVLSDYWKLAKYHICLSGTPMTRNVVDCYTTFSRILPEEETFTSFWKFAANYSYQKPTPFGVDYYGLKNPEKLSSIIRSNFFIRYRKDEVLKQLPSKIFQTITLPESYAVELRDADKQETAYREYQKRIADLIAGKPLPPEPATLAEHRRLQGERKVPAMVDFIKDQMEQENPLVVFAYHKSVIAQLADELSAYNPVVITGETPSSVRASYVDAFQSGETNLFLGNIVAAGVGITLHAASTVLLAEYSWIPSDIAQAVDRVHRIGQENQVLVYTMVAANSLDETMCDVVLRRAKEASKVFDTVAAS